MGLTSTIFRKGFQLRTTLNCGLISSREILPINGCVIFKIFCFSFLFQVSNIFARSTLLAPRRAKVSERLVEESEAHVIVLLLGLLLLLLLLGRRLSSHRRSSTTGSSGSRSSSSTTTHAGELGETSGDQLLSGLALTGGHHLGQSLFVRLNSDRGENLLHVGGGDLVLSHGAEQSSSDVTHGELLSR